MIQKTNPKSEIAVHRQKDRPIVPQHIGIIMDGNGRWARRRGALRFFGHEAGAKRVNEVVTACKNLGVKVLTLYAFSDENWRRPRIEVSFLMRLLKAYLHKELDTFMKNDVRLKVIGDISRFPKKVQDEIASVLDKTSENRTMILNLALGYGGRQEIVRAVYRLFVQRGAEIQGALSDESKALDLIYSGIECHLDTATQPDPDLIIRTSGEYRISNFLLWQASYAEIYISDVLWPEFTADELMKAVTEYGRRERRFGGIEGG